MKHRLIFLGTGAGGGVPSFFCSCKACLEAAGEPRYRRTRCGIVIRGSKNTLIDSPPDLRSQLLAAGVGRVDDLILTHEHYDHSGGLGELEFSVRVEKLDPIPSYMSSESEAWMWTAFGFMADCLTVHTVKPGQQFVIDAIIYRVLEVAHGPGTFGLLMKTEQGRTAYIPDTGPLPASTLEQIRGVDILILGATFWGKNPMPEDHLSVEEALRIAGEIKAKNFYLTHLSMHYDTAVTNHELESYLKPFGDSFRVALDGLSINI